ncbi:arylamine N-acetyltransferase family protein [Sphingomonas sp.]|uniref:arylamine N-acetyltransferase family protein n=1 Tax=Sphingomonas sp. TaxID=28214 RepID=UPI003CC59776
MFDLPAYLARVQLPTRVTDDAAGLHRLQRAHRLAIPFENLDVALGRAIAVDSAGVFAKLVTARRGGYCFEHNRLFGDALAALGFVARPLSAQVLLSGTPTPPGTHALSLVTIDRQDWIADAGFGGSYSPPMPLSDGAEASAPDGARFRLEAADGGWALLRDGDPGTTDGRGGGAGWRPQYRFTTAAVDDAAIAAGNRWASTDPASRFVQHRIVSIVLPRGFARLTDRHYRRQVGSEVGEGEITDPRVYRLRLSLMFGIDLTAAEVGALELWPSAP